MFFKPMLLPLIAMVAITFAVWLTMYFTRMNEIVRKRIHPQALASQADALKLLTDSAGPANNLRNLFEMPILFYVAILLTLILLIQDAVLIGLSWTYVALRAAHSLIHCTYNRVMHRFVTYAASCVVLLLMWLQFAWYVITN